MRGMVHYTEVTERQERFGCDLIIELPPYSNTLRYSVNATLNFAAVHLGLFVNLSEFSVLHSRTEQNSIQEYDHFLAEMEVFQSRRYRMASDHG